MKHVENQISLPSQLLLYVSIAAIFQLCRYRTLAVFLIYLSFPIWSQCLSPMDFTFGSVSSVSSNLDSLLVQALLTSCLISLMSISYPSCSSCILLLNSFLGTIFILLLEWLKTELICFLPCCVNAMVWFSRTFFFCPHSNCLTFPSTFPSASTFLGPGRPPVSMNGHTHTCLRNLSFQDSPLFLATRHYSVLTSNLATSIEPSLVILLLHDDSFLYFYAHLAWPYHTGCNSVLSWS